MFDEGGTVWAIVEMFRERRSGLRSQLSGEIIPNHGRHPLTSHRILLRAYAPRRIALCHPAEAPYVGE
jgi:hypothetical protein